MFKEYVGLAKLVGGIVLALVLLIGGCSYGKNTLAKENTRLEGEVSRLLETTRQWEAIDKQNRATIAANKRAAEEWKKKADDSAEAVAKARKAAEKANKERADALAKARRDPDCAELLRRNVCVIVPLP